MQTTVSDSDCTDTGLEPGRLLLQIQANSDVCTNAKESVHVFMVQIDICTCLVAEMFMILLCLVRGPMCNLHNGVLWWLKFYTLLS